MNVDTAIQDQCAVGRFDPNHNMTKKSREKLLATALLSPALINKQNWHFVVVDDQEQRRRIRDASWGREQITDASMLIILCADLRAWEQESIHFWRSSSSPFREFIMPTTRQSCNRLEPVQRDEVMRSCGIAAQTIMLTARSMGYDACPIDGFDFDAVADFINLPDDCAVCMLVVVGKSIDPPRSRDAECDMEEIVITDSF